MGWTKDTSGWNGEEMKEFQKTVRLFDQLGPVITRLGINHDNEQMIYRAFEDMLRKKRVSAEELRRVLGDRIPGVFGIAARALNMSTDRLDYMLREGTLVSAYFVPRLIKQLNIEIK